MNIKRMVGCTLGGQSANFSWVGTVPRIESAVNFFRFAKREWKWRKFFKVATVDGSNPAPVDR